MMTHWAAVWFFLTFCVLAQTKSVCIVGSGIGGSSVAKFLRETDANVELHVFESRGDLGGRAKTLVFDGLSRPVDAGGSIMHKENRYLHRFAKALDLEISSPGKVTSFICVR